MKQLPIFQNIAQGDTFIPDLLFPSFLSFNVLADPNGSILEKDSDHFSPLSTLDA